MDKVEAPKKEKSLRTLKKELISREEAIGRIGKIAARSDYECAVIAAALIEHLIRLALATHFVSMSESMHNSIFSSGGTGPLGTFSNKIKIAYALGIFDTDVKREIDRVRDIRNTFSHHPDIIDFSNEAISHECDQFSKRIDMKNNVPNLFDLPMNISKRRYLEATIFLAATLSTYTLIFENSGDRKMISFEIAGL